MRRARKATLSGHTGCLLSFQEVEQNLRAMFRHVATGRPQGEVREFAGLTIASAGSAFQMFNAAFFNSPVTDQVDLERRIALAKALFGARGLDWSLWVCEELVAEPLRRKLSRTCERAGLHLSSEMPAMLAERLTGMGSESPGFEIRPVDSMATVRQFCRIGASCFSVPLEWFEEIFNGTARFEGALSGWVGYHEGKAVSTAATVDSGNAIGLYNLATERPYRERGFGEALMRYAIRQAITRAGDKPLVLQSTRQGLRLYQRLGFRNVGRILVFPSR